MNTSFSSFYPYTLDLDSDHTSFYHVETFDNGLVYQLCLIHTASSMIIDQLSLERKCSLENVHSIWHNHKVITARYDRNDYIDSASEEELIKIQQYFDSRNQMTVVEFLNDHNNREDSIDQALFNHAILAGQRIQEGY